MTITVTGILKDPLGNILPNDSIRFTSLDQITGSDAVHVTDEFGVYDFELSFGKYRIEINYDGCEYHELGTVTVNEFTPSPISLVDLILYNSPVIPPIIIDTDPDWDQLFDAVKANGEHREGVVQIRDDESYTSEVKELWRASEAVMTDESLESSTEDSKITTQLRVYEDDNLNHMAAITHEGETLNIRTYSSLEAFEASNGNQEIKAIEILTGSKGEIVDSKNVDNDGLIINKEVSFETTNITETVTADITSLNLNKNILVNGSSSEIFTSFAPLDIQHETNLNMSEELNAITHTGYVKDRQELNIDGNEVARGSHQSSVKVYNKETYSKLTINEGISKCEIQADNYCIQDDAGFVLAEFDTVNNKLTISGRLEIQNAEDFKGDTGDTIDYVYQYSADNGVTDAWHETYDPTHPDRWRRDRKRINEVEVGSWSEGVYLNAVDGRDGDTYWNQYQYSTDDTTKGLDQWHNDYIDGDDWRRWRVIENGSPVGPTHQFYGPDSGWFIEKLKGLDGPAGWVPHLQYQYSVDNLPPWHNDFITGDIYRREKVDWYASSDDFLNKDDPVNPSTPILIGVWTSGAKIVPEAGVDYGSKYSTIMMYKRSNLTLSPTDDPGLVQFDFDTVTITPASTNGWTSNIPAGLEDLWVAVATSFSLGSTDSIDDWVVEKFSSSGFKSAIGWLYQRTNMNSNLNSFDLPSQPLNYDFLTGKVTASNASYLKDWSNEIPDDTGNSRLWVTFNTALAPVSEFTDVLDSADWETPAIMTQSGSDGDEGSFTSFIFKNSSSQPSTPSGGSYNGSSETYPSTWNDDPTTPSSGQFTWISRAVYRFEDNSWNHSGWSTPSKHSGEDGKDFGRFTSFVYLNAASQPSTPSSGSGSFNGITETPPSGGWTDGSITPTNGEKSWVTSTIYTYDDDSGLWDHGPWQTPSQFSGNDGTSGINGSGWYYWKGVSSFLFLGTETFNWNNSTAQTTILNAFGAIAGRAPVNGDIFVLSTINDSHSDTGIYDEDTGEFEAIASIINGNVLIDGTLNATKIKTNSITANQIQGDTITGNEISATSRIIVGSGDDIAGLNGEDSGSYGGYRIWSGDELPANAPFSVDRDGAVIAENIYARGDIEATNLSVSLRAVIGSGNDVVGLNGLDSGSYGSWRIWAGNALPASAPFRVNRDGVLTASGATITGDIYMQNAAVDTLQIAGNAVTILQGASGNSVLSFTFVNDSPNDMDVFITLGGFYIGASNEGSPSNTVYLKAASVIELSQQLNDYSSFNLATILTLPTGSTNIELDFANTNGGEQFLNTYLTAVGAKR